LAVALFHQLGACPCGCIDGNLWIQTILRVAHLAPQGSAPFPTKPFASIDSQGCEEDHASIAYVPSDSGSFAHSFGAIFSSATPIDEIAADHAIAKQRLADSSWPDIGTSAQTLRAQRQLFLI
jgi:hypothetical protein